VRAIGITTWLKRSDFYVKNDTGHVWGVISSIGLEGELVMDDRTETAATVARVKAWKQHRTGQKPPFRDYQVYYRQMRWGPFSYWTWRGILVLISAALILYVALFTACLSGGGGCRPSITWDPVTWFLRPLP